MFQFQTGSIRSAIVINRLIDETCFNSKLVRLEDGWYLCGVITFTESFNSPTW